MDEEGTPSFVVYSTVNGPVCVQDPVEIDILRKLEGRDLSLTEISRSMKRPHSTMSIALKEMEGKRLLSTYPDGTDGRKRMYRLDSRLQFKSGQSHAEMSSDLINLMRNIVNDEEDFTGGMLTAVLASFIISGLDIAPFAENLGMMFGNVLSEKIGDSKIEDVIKRVSDFYERKGISRMTVVTYIPITIRVENIDRETIGTREILSPFTQGLFKAIFINRSGKEYVATSVKTNIGIPNAYEFTLEPDNGSSEKNEQLCFKRDKIPLRND